MHILLFLIIITCDCSYIIHKDNIHILFFFTHGCQDTELTEHMYVAGSVIFIIIFLVGMSMICGSPLLPQPTLKVMVLWEMIVAIVHSCSYNISL